MHRIFVTHEPFSIDPNARVLNMARKSPRECPQALRRILHRNSTTYADWHFTSTLLGIVRKTNRMSKGYPIAGNAVKSRAVI
jgi:hypothetical protein